MFLFACKFPVYDQVLLSILVFRIPHKAQIIFTPVCKLHISFFRAKIKDGHLRIVFTAFKFTAEQLTEESKGNYLLAEIYFELLCAV